VRFTGDFTRKDFALEVSLGYIVILASALRGVEPHFGEVDKHMKKSVAPGDRGEEFHPVAQLVGCNDTDADLPDLLPKSGWSIVGIIAFVRFTDASKVSLEIFPSHADSVVFNDDLIGFWLGRDLDHPCIGIIGVVDQLL
jgi:hypothetical protein